MPLPRNTTSHNAGIPPGGKAADEYRRAMSTVRPILSELAAIAPATPPAIKPLIHDPGRRFTILSDSTTFYIQNESGTAFSLDIPNDGIPAKYILAILGSASAFMYLGPSGLTAAALAAFPILHLRDAGPDRTMAVIRTFEAVTERTNPKEWLGPLDLSVRDLYMPSLRPA